MDTYTVVTLGLPGSGKTTYLATLNHLLSRQALADGVVIKAKPAAAHAALEDLYAQYVDPSQDWPPGTRGAREWTFACEVRSGRRAFPVLELSYLDYEGEWVARTQAAEREAARELFDSLDQGTAMLVLIDGERVLDLAEGRVAGEEFYLDNIDRLVSWMNYCPGPIHLVVSKWDLLAERGHTLDEVKELLLGLGGGQLRKIAAGRSTAAGTGRRRGVVRLIPVSSLRGFAYLGPEGQMLKDPDRSPLPLNVDIPLAAVLPDLCIGAAEQLQQMLAGDAGDEPPAPGSADWFAQQLDAAREGASGRVVPLVILAGAATVGLVKVSGKAMRPVRALARRRPRRLRAVRTHEAALLYTARAMNRRLQEFQNVNTGSRLA